ncbi:hypothetical protein EIP91_006124 [Steccherinum ochraceum]|uniref:Major facilitator superfamily (MFS) profile domain-containing protein n=1 Tax=Steccherinum ochraceum TaxID=92696 RepID=A0A4R0RMI9_9APHY|nr:hypothetical protein EIP91_006124 [Steccherinum ochraceum]
MAYFLYKYLRRKYNERNAAQSQDPVAESPSLQHQGEGEAYRPTAPNDTAPPRSRKMDRAAIIRTIMLMVGLAIPVFLETLDYTIVAAAQAHIASIFNHLDLQSYIGTVYLLTSTVFLPVFASFADIFGRHWTLQLALLLFMVGSAAVRIILADSVSLDANNYQQSAMFLLYTIGFCLGPFIGGELLNVSFRWVFAINLPIAGAAMVLAFLTLRNQVKGSTAAELPGRREVPFSRRLLQVDWIGATLFTGAGILVLLALNWGSSEKWNSAKVIASWVVGGVLFIAFMIWEYILEYKIDQGYENRSSARGIFVDPMIPLSLFRSADVCIVQYATFVTGIIMLVMFYFVAIFATIVKGSSPDKAGAQLIYFAPGMGGGSILSIYWIKIFRQPKYPAILGGVVQTVALGLISWAMQKNDQGLVNGFMVMAGAGVGLTIGPLAVHARFSQSEHLVAVVSGLTLFFRSFGGTVGLAQCGAVLNAKVNHYIANAITSGAISGADIASIAASTASTGLSSLQSISDLPEDVQGVVRDAFRNALRWCFISLIPWSALSAVLTVFLSHIQDRAHLAQQHGQPKRSEDNVVLESVDNTPKTDSHQMINMEKKTPQYL